MTTPAPTIPQEPTRKLLVPIVFGLVGKKGSGKDTVGAIIRQLMEDIYPCYRIAFADEVKRCLADLTGGKVETIEKNKKNPWMRKLLQYLGTDIARQENNNHWIDVAAAKVKDIVNANLVRRPLIYFTDVRFKNEAEFVRSIGGLILKVERNYDQTDTHASETELEGIIPDFHIDNKYNGIHRLTWETKSVLGMIREHTKF